jgi:hypothetical protein
VDSGLFLNAAIRMGIQSLPYFVAYGHTRLWYGICASFRLFVHPSNYLEDWRTFMKIDMSMMPLENDQPLYF